MIIFKCKPFFSLGKNRIFILRYFDMNLHLKTGIYENTSSSLLFDYFSDEFIHSTFVIERKFSDNLTIFILPPL